MKAAEGQRVREPARPSSPATITAVKTAVVSVPLPRPVAWSNVRVDSREYVLVWIASSDGQEGFGFSLGSRFAHGGRTICAAVDDLLAPILIGRDPSEIER